MGRDARDMSEDELEFDDEYFARTYRPLSNLPTPPPSSRNTSVFQSPQSSLGDGEKLDPSLFGMPRIPVGQPCLACVSNC